MYYCLIIANLTIEKLMSHFKIVEIADIHFGNGRIAPSDTYENLNKFVYPQLEDANLFVINGDTFDTMLNMNSDAGFYVAQFINDAITLASKCNFFIRVVRGTFSHDRHQNRFFLVRGRENMILNDRPLIKVYDTIAIENFNGMNFLFCPDNLPFKDLTQEVIDVIEANHLKEVDGVFSHGYFNHLLPDNLPHIPTDTLNWELLKNKVKGYVLNGHVHHMSVKDRVISSGSFERFDHSTTEKVGFWVINIEDGKWTPTFIENKNAVEFRTFYPLIDAPDEDLVQQIKNYIGSLIYDGYPATKPIYIRIAGKDNGISQTIKSEYPNVIVSITPPKSLQEETTDNSDIICGVLPSITEDNLPELIHQAIEPKDVLSLDTIKEILNAI